jgi:hypothetical protein
MLLRAITVRLVNAVNPVVSHCCYPFIEMNKPVRAAGPLIFVKGPARFVVLKTRLAGLDPEA